jgi:predicted nucleic acid-binding protein
MKKIFLDANVVIDFLDVSSKDHAAAVSCVRIIRKHFRKPVVSPVTFIIVNFLLGKFIKNKQWHKRQMELVFSAMEITPLQPSFIDAAFKTYFTDMEDALQHQCALQAKASVIITRDIHDYFDSKIPVVHPHDFVLRYNSLPGF